MMKLIKAIHSALVELYLIPVKLYRRFFSRFKPVSTCRFTPTCSQYALGCIREWGIILGSLLALFRVLRCNPFSRGGEDPVPLRSEVVDRVRRILFRK